VTEAGFECGTGTILNGIVHATTARRAGSKERFRGCVLLDIDTHGARQLRQRYPEAVSIFIMAPSMKELEARLRERRSDAPGEIARRLSRAREEITAWRQYDYLIINRDVKEAVDQLATVIEAERWRTSRLTLKFPDVEVPE
jgi:guanylate kinase